VLYVSGAAIAYTRLGRPDIGFVGLTEIAETVTAVRDRVAAHLVVDADTGYGNALNVERAVRLLERAGANAIQLEDQDFPKRCGHLDDKALVPASEMAGKIKAAVDARASSQTLIIARTDAVAVEGLERAVARALLYREAGADVLFIEALREHAEIDRIGTLMGRSVPLMVNMVEGGKTPILSASELQALGFSLVIFPGAIVRVLAKVAEEFYGALKQDGTTTAFRSRMFDFDALNRLLGTPEMLERGKSYADLGVSRKRGLEQH
ncbi:MAG: isocitrate lyase/phosphoenolpyruvate mutase family protein, partial [Pseudolabrys sp.]|nr:isocitrate lyase/phosphoenolpyruvate mutase family protein [Pseudolabrys sp.]